MCARLSASLIAPKAARFAFTSAAVTSNSLFPRARHGAATVPGEFISVSQRGRSSSNTSESSRARTNPKSLSLQNYIINSVITTLAAALSYVLIRYRFGTSTSRPFLLFFFCFSSISWLVNTAIDAKTQIVRDWEQFKISYSLLN